MRKQIQQEGDIQAWELSIAYAVIMDFLTRCNDTMKASPNFEDMEENPAAKAIIDLLNMLRGAVLDTPLQAHEQSRFGNPAFRAWMERLHSHWVPEWKQLVLSLSADRKIDQRAQTEGIMDELGEYLEQSFGSSVRLDYGTGHELSFLAFLCCCEKLQFWPPSHSGKLVNILLKSYLDLVRVIQRYFKLEPAGSRGVWGLDDYQFLPFLFGSAQLISPKDPRLSTPDIINKPAVVQQYRKQYLYLDAIAFICETKRGPFYEHSPILYDVSGLASWDKINAGMIKMYQKEVLGKFPVVQHFLFGVLLPWNKCG